MLELFSDWLGTASLLVIGLVIGIGLIVSAKLGSVLRRRRTGGDGTRETASESGEQALTLSSVMGLLALLVAFTFSIAIERFDTRRVNVLNEANAIGTTYLRAQLLDQPHRTRISALLVDYTETRVALATARHLAERRALLARNDALIVRSVDRDRRRLSLDAAL